MSARDLPDTSASLSPPLNLPEALPPSAAVDAHAHLEPGVVLGAHCVVRSGAYLASGTQLGERVYVGPNVAFSDAEGDAAAAVVESGVEGVIILDGRVPHSVLLELLTPHGVGTRISRIGV